MTLYAPDELVLVHAVEWSQLESRIRNDGARSRRILAEHEDGSVAAARRSLGWVSALIQKRVGSTKEVCDVGAPVSVLLDTARTTGAALIVVGQKSVRERMEETMGSVAHRVCLNAHCSTLVVRKPTGTPRRILALVQQAEDIVALQRWLHAFPFQEQADLTLLCLLPPSQPGDPIGPFSARFWNEAAVTNARSLMDQAVKNLHGPLLRVTGRTVHGDPSSIILQEAVHFDLLMLYGSDRKGRDPRRSGLPWRTLLRLAPCSVLVVRTSDPSFSEVSPGCCAASSGDERSPARPRNQPSGR